MGFSGHAAGLGMPCTVVRACTAHRSVILPLAYPPTAYTPLHRHRHRYTHTHCISTHISSRRTAHIVAIIISGSFISTSSFGVVSCITCIRILQCYELEHLYNDNLGMNLVRSSFSETALPNFITCSRIVARHEAYEPFCCVRVHSKAVVMRDLRCYEFRCIPSTNGA
ncbi:hypothetical protein BDZ89DRAFT_433209 [Hymenopellis radicata]|nr:hypothetical protein BDZ89DRAFT_433209 [Hymenopellis radicata]